MQSRPLVGIAFALAAAAGYGFAPPIARVAFENGVPGWESAFARSSAVILVFAAVGAAMRVPFAVPRGAWPSLLALTASTAVVSPSYLASVEFIPVSLGVIIFYTFPILVLLVSPLLERRPLGLRRILLALLAFLGLMVAIGPSFGDLDMRGVAFAGLASLGAAAQLFAGRALSARMRPLAFGLLVHLMIWPALLVACLWWSGGSLRLLAGPVTPEGYLAVSTIGAIFVIAYFLHMKCLGFAPASTVAPFFNIEPVTTMAVAALLLGETLLAHQYAGGAMVLTALALAGLEGRSRPLAEGRGTR